jgi:ABC-type transport system involved in multi-copper enzyme maturation permease subunit
MADLSVARYVSRLLLRSRLAILLGAAGLLAIAGSFVLTWLTPGTERRVFLDATYLAIEWLAILGPVMGSTVLQIQEFDQRTIWLVLVRPPGRAAFVRGRFAGLAFSSAGILLACGAVVAILLRLSGGWPEPYLSTVLVAGLGEIVLLSAVGGLVTFLTTSYLTGLLVQAGIVILGYLSSILPYLASRESAAGLKPVIWAVYWAVPHLGDFAVREFTSPAEDWYLAALCVYAALYAGVVTGLAVLVFRRRDV